MMLIEHTFDDRLAAQPAPKRRFRLRRWQVVGLGLALPICLIATLLGPSVLDSSPNNAAQKPTPAMTVTTAPAVRVTWPAAFAASGAIAAWQEASIGTQVGNYRLVDVRVNVGDQVRRGQILARLDPALLHAEEAQLMAAFEQHEANRRRALGLQKSGAISDQEVLQFVTQARTAAALLQANRLQLSYTAILAPDDGVISARPATVGAVVPAGTELFRLIRQNRLEWRGELTAAQLAQIRPGQRIALQLPDMSAAAAIVRTTAPGLDDQSRLGIVYADLLGESAARAGMYANGDVIVGQTPALVIRSECVVIRDGRTYVLKLADASATPKVALQPVTLGRRRGDQVEILQGLNGAESLVLKGAGFLNDGDIVHVASQPGSRRS